jgi:hypothetical protein
MFEKHEFLKTAGKIQSEINIAKVNKVYKR